MNATGHSCCFGLIVVDAKFSQEKLVANEVNTVLPGVVPFCGHGVVLSHNALIDLSVAFEQFPVDGLAINVIDHSQRHVRLPQGMQAGRGFHQAVVSDSGG